MVAVRAGQRTVSRRGAENPGPCNAEVAAMYGGIESAGEQVRGRRDGVGRRQSSAVRCSGAVYLCGRYGR